MKTRLFVFVVSSILLGGPTAIAHHSFATHYDGNNIVEISGVLSDVKMRSPHSFFEVEVTNDDGTTETWEVEAHAVPILRARVFLPVHHVRVF